jgi:hypothetical protein
VTPTRWSEYLAGEIAAPRGSQPVLFAREDGATFVELLDPLGLRAEVVQVLDADPRKFARLAELCPDATVPVVTFHRVDLCHPWGTHGPFESYFELLDPWVAEVPPYTEDGERASGPAVLYQVSPGVVHVTVFAEGGLGNTWVRSRVGGS